MLDKSNDRLRRIAFHEAGHAWMMVREGLGVISTSIKPLGSIQGDNRGETIPEEQMKEGRKDLSEKFARAALAGSAAELYLLGKWDEESLQAGAYDTGKARSYLVMSGDDWRSDSLDYYVQTMSSFILDEISQPRTWNTITSLAYKLLESNILTGEQVISILSDN